MDKQSLKASTDTNSLRNSYRSISRSGFIQTLAAQNDTDMKKSRIYNLPSYKKTDLSNKLDIVVVFQTIEITRLSEEIETLRVALMDYQRQVNNYRNYEIQIRQLNEKVCEYEEERAAYQEEIEKLNLICQQLYADLEREKEKSAEFGDTGRVLEEGLRKEKERSQEVARELERWRNRYQALEKSKQAEMEELKLSLQTQRKSVLHKQLTQLTTKFTTQITSLQKEIHNLRQALSSQKQSQKHLTLQLTKRQVQLQNLSSLKGQVREYENRFHQIQNEFMKLNELLRKKEEQQQKFREEEKRLTAKVKEYERKFEKEYKQKLRECEGLEKAHKELKEKAIRQEMEIEGLQEASVKAEKLQALLNQAGDQIDRLNSIIKDKIKYIEAWNDKYELLQASFNQMQKNKENETIKVENKLIEKEKELTRVGMQAKSRLQQVESLKEKLLKTQKQLKQVATSLRTEQQKLQQKNDSLTILTRQLQQKLVELQHDNDDLKSKQQQLKRFKQQLEPQYKKQLASFSQALKQKESQISVLTQKMQQLKHNSQQNTQAFSEELQLHKKKANQMVKFVDQLNGVIQEKVKEVKMFKEALVGIDRRVGECQVVEKKLAGLMAEKEKLLKDLEAAQQENNSLFDKQLQTENKLFTLDTQLFEQTQHRSTLLNQIKFLQQEKAILAQQQQQTTSQLKASFQRQRVALLKHKEFQKKVEELEQKGKVLAEKLSKREKEGEVSQQEWRGEMERVREEVMRWKEKVEAGEKQLHAVRMEVKKQEGLREQEKREHESLIQSLRSQSQKLTLDSTRQLTLIESQLKTQLQHHKSSHTKAKQLSQSLQMKLKQASQTMAKLQTKNKKLQQKVQEQQKQLHRLQQQCSTLETQLKTKKKQSEQLTQRYQELQQSQKKEKKTIKNALESRDEEYLKLKSKFEKEKLKSQQEIQLLGEEKQRMLKELGVKKQEVDRVNEELKKVMYEGRNSKQFLEQFNSLKLQSQSVTEFLQQISSHYFVTSPVTQSSQLYIENQLTTLKQVLAQNLKLYSDTVKTYQQKIKDLIEKNEQQLKESNQMTDMITRLKEDIIRLESEVKLLTYENEQNGRRKVGEEKRGLGKSGKLVVIESSPTPSLLLSSKEALTKPLTSPRTTTQKKNISTLFQSQIDSSSSIIEPLCKDNPQQTLERDSKKLASSGVRSMKNLITPFGSPSKAKLQGDMVESTVFQVEAANIEKNTDYFSRFARK